MRNRHHFSEALFESLVIIIYYYKHTTNRTLNLKKNFKKVFETSSLCKYLFQRH